MLRVFIATAIAAATVAWPVPPPPPAVRVVTDDYFGHRLVDRYRYFENLKDPSVQAYFRQQADYTNEILARLGPARESLRADVTRLTNAGTRVNTVVRVGARIFYLERPAGADAYRLMVADGTAPPRMLLDPVALQRETGSKAHLVISNVLPAPDGAHVAVGIVPGGAEHETHTRIVDTASGALLADDFPRTWFGATAWTEDGKTIFYNQLPLLAAGESENDRELRSIVYRHTLGAATADTAIFGTGIAANVPFAPTDVPVVNTSTASNYAVGVVLHGVQNEATLYVAARAALGGDGPIAWRKVADVDDAVTGFDLHGSTMYLLSHKDAPHFRVSALDLARTGRTAADATPVVSESDVVINQVSVAADGLYVRGFRKGLGRLRKVAFGSSTAADVALPFDGAIAEFTTDPRVAGALVGLTAWTKPLQIYAVDAGGGVTATSMVKPPDIDTSRYASVEVEAPSADGTLVPLSIVTRRDVRLNGDNPTYLEAYGSYGITLDPEFLNADLAWLDAGGVYAIAHTRGGGENGEEWHIAGKGPTKQHTIDDAVAAARYLIAKGYTSPAHLGIEGTSAGGIMVGGAITQHPELFAAALDVVGWTDGLRSEAAEPNGAGNVPEFGSPKTEPGFAALYTMDAYQHIVDGGTYPAVMAVTGINDPRVAPWQPAKFAARLAAASHSGRPVLLRVDYDAGHGALGASSQQRIALLTDEFSFLLWQCGGSQFAAIPQFIATK